MIIWNIAPFYQGHYLFVIVNTVLFRLNFVPKPFGCTSPIISTCAVITIFNLHWLNIQCPQPGHWPVSPGYPKYVVLRLRYLRPPHVTSDTLHYTIQITICIFACQQATQFYFNIQTSFNNMSCNINQCLVSLTTIISWYKNITHVFMRANCNFYLLCFLDIGHFGTHNCQKFENNAAVCSFLVIF